MQSIYKTWFNEHIDLSHILSISDALFVDKMGCGGLYIEFSIEFILRDKPIIYSFDTQKNLHMEFTQYPSKEFKLQALKLVQDNLDVLIASWKDYKLSTLK